MPVWQRPRACVAARGSMEGTLPGSREPWPVGQRRLQAACACLWMTRPAGHRHLLPGLACIFRRWAMAGRGYTEGTAPGSREPWPVVGSMGAGEPARARGCHVRPDRGTDSGPSRDLQPTPLGGWMQSCPWHGALNGRRLRHAWPRAHAGYLPWMRGHTPGTRESMLEAGLRACRTVRWCLTTWPVSGCPGLAPCCTEALGRPLSEQWAVGPLGW